MGHDIISELPDSLIAKILSYLTISDSVKTSVLSKRWEDLCLKVYVLDLTTIKSSLRVEALERLIHRFVKLNRGSCLQNFKIKCGYYHYPKQEREIIFSDFFENKKKIKYYHSIDCNKRVLDLIAEVIYRGVQHLDVETDMCQPTIDFMPTCVYVSKKLVSLKLINVGLENPKFVVSLPCLKIMHLENICYREDCGLLITKRLISASTVLEDLTFDFLVSSRLERIYFHNVPQCLKSTLEYVKINKMKADSGIKLVNYFLGNSAVLKNLTLSFSHSSTSTKKQEAEFYEKLLASTKLSSTCEVIIDWHACHWAHHPLFHSTLV